VKRIRGRRKNEKTEKSKEKCEMKSSLQFKRKSTLNQLKCFKNKTGKRPSVKNL